MKACGTFHGSKFCTHHGIHTKRAYVVFEIRANKSITVLSSRSTGYTSFTVINEIIECSRMLHGQHSTGWQKHLKVSPEFSVLFLLDPAVVDVVIPRFVSLFGRYSKRCFTPIAPSAVSHPSHHTRRSKAAYCASTRSTIGVSSTYLR
eukprot:1571580-Pleurochrysis_carterae.AAC.1